MVRLHKFDWIKILPLKKLSKKYLTTIYNPWMSYHLSFTFLNIRPNWADQYNLYVLNEFNLKSDQRGFTLEPYKQYWQNIPVGPLKRDWDKKSSIEMIDNSHCTGESERDGKCWFIALSFLWLLYNTCDDRFRRLENTA